MSENNFNFKNKKRYKFNEFLLFLNLKFIMNTKKKLKKKSKKNLIKMKTIN